MKKSIAILGVAFVMLSFTSFTKPAFISPNGMKIVSTLNIGAGPIGGGSTTRP